MSASIHHTEQFTAHPSRVYEALVTSEKFVAVTGAPAEIGVGPGDAFSMFGGAIVGRHIELVPGRRLVQAWRVATWPEGAYSLVHFALKNVGAGTELDFHHVGFPEGEHDDLNTGWTERYWEPLRAYLK
ncbi:MAG: SRPBCC domain-containing protein [Gemmatimonadaceae bacterium]